MSQDHIYTSMPNVQGAVIFCCYVVHMGFTGGYMGAGRKVLWLPVSRPGRSVAENLAVLTESRRWQNYRCWSCTKATWDILDSNIREMCLGRQILTQLFRWGPAIGSVGKDLAVAGGGDWGTNTVEFFSRWYLFSICYNSWGPPLVGRQKTRYG